MRWAREICAAAAVVGCLLLAATPSPAFAPQDAGEDAPAELGAKQLERILRHSPLPDPPADPTNAVADDPRAAHLGRFLFFDARLSRDGTVSCATCHDPAQGFGDGKSLGEGLAQLTRHSQPLWNVAYNRWFFWDGRADTLWAQALQPLEDPREMGFTRLEVAHLLNDDAELRPAYEALFGPLPDLDDGARFPAAGRPVADDPEHAYQRAWGAMSAADRRAVDRVFANVGKTLAAYQRLLLSRRAPFDVFVEGLQEEDPEKLAVLLPAARRGLALFFGETSCRLCHHGPTFSDLEFHNNMVPPLSAQMAPDSGRKEGIARLRANPFNALSEFADARGEEQELKLTTLIETPEIWGSFKTPTLRNVARTAPYMHQGQFATLEDVLRYYSTLEGAVQPRGHRERILVPQELTDEEIADLIAFLQSLTDEALDPELLRQPERPRP